MLSIHLWRRYRETIVSGSTGLRIQKKFQSIGTNHRQRRKQLIADGEIHRRKMATFLGPRKFHSIGTRKVKREKTLIRHGNSSVQLTWEELPQHQLQHPQLYGHVTPIILLASRFLGLHILLQRLLRLRQFKRMKNLFMMRLKRLRA